jgi:hypothetical protein
MAKIRITKEYPAITSGVKNPVQFMVGEVYEATMPTGGNTIQVKKVVANRNTSAESANLAWVDLPYGYFEIISDKNINLDNLKQRLDFFEPKPLDPDVHEDLTKTDDKASKSAGYIVLGIMVISLISFYLMTRNTK